MKAVVQVVSDAKLYVESKLISQISKGMVVFFCVEKGDGEEKLNYFVKKISAMRVFADQNGKTNLSLKDVGGEILFVSQFTLAADCSRGNRPDFFKAEEPARAKDMYLKCANLLKETGLQVKLGVFGADMKIKQTNDGPFTVILQN